MSKFDNVFKKYLNEETITVNTDPIQTAASKLKSDPQMAKVAPVLDAMTNALDTDNIHKGLNSVIDPKNPKKFSEVFTNENDKEAALKHLADQGVPIGNTEQTKQQNQNSQQNPNNQQQNKSINNSTNTSSSTSYGGSSTQGGTLQGI